MFKSKYLSIEYLFLFSSLFASLYNTLNTDLFLFSTNPFLYLSLLLGIFLIFKTITKKQKKFNKYSYLLLGFLIINIISTLFINNNINKNSIIILIVNIIMIVNLYAINSIREYKLCYIIIVSFSTILCMISLILAGLDVDFVYYGNKLTGIYANPNHGGQVTLISILILIYSLKKEEYKIIKIFCLLLNLIFLCFNANRNAILILLLFLFAYIIKKSKLLNLKFIKIGIVLAILLLSIIFLINVTGSLNVNNYSNLELALNKLSTERYAIWKESIYLIKQNFWFGYGLTNLSAIALSEIGAISRIVTRGITATHNVLIQVFIDGGIFSFLLFISFLFLLFKKIVQIVKTGNFFAEKSFVCYLVISSFLFSLLDIGIINYLQLTSFIFWTHSMIILNHKE